MRDVKIRYVMLLESTGNSASLHAVYGYKTKSVLFVEDQHQMIVKVNDEAESTNVDAFSTQLYATQSFMQSMEDSKTSPG